MEIVELTEDTAAAPVRKDALYRFRFETQVLQAPKEEENGDVTFGCVGVDKKKVPNRRGFVFDWDSPDDVDIENFLKNPVMPYAHERESYPIGRWEQISVGARQIVLNGRIPGGPDYEDIRPVRVRVRDGYLKAVSIGFYITRFEEVRDPKSNELLYIKIKAFELIECSPCPVGAHETAIIGQDKALTIPKHADFALPAGSRWISEDQFDTQAGGRCGKLLRLSLGAGETKPLADPQCPKCGSVKSHSVRKHEDTPQEYVTRRCDGCGYTWPEPGSAAAPILPAVSAATGTPGGADAVGPTTPQGSPSLDLPTIQGLIADSEKRTGELLTAFETRISALLKPKAETPPANDTTTQSAPAASSDSPAPSTPQPGATAQEDPAEQEARIAQALEPLVRQAVQSVFANPEFQKLRAQMGQAVVAQVREANRQRRRRAFNG